MLFSINHQWKVSFPLAPALAGLRTPIEIGLEPLVQSFIVLVSDSVVCQEEEDDVVF